MARTERITWEKVYKEFRTHHPYTAKKVYHWYPGGFSKIKIKLIDGSVIFYDYDTTRIEFTDERWK